MGAAPPICVPSGSYYYTVAQGEKTASPLASSGAVTLDGSICVLPAHESLAPDRQAKVAAWLRTSCPVVILPPPLPFVKPLVSGAHTTHTKLFIVGPIAVHFTKPQAPGKPLLVVVPASLGEGRPNAFVLQPAHDAEDECLLLVRRGLRFLAQSAPDVPNHGIILQAPDLFEVGGLRVLVVVGAGGLRPPSIGGTGLLAVSTHVLGNGSSLLRRGSHRAAYKVRCQLLSVAD
jgi:hypothetical protein